MSVRTFLLPDLGEGLTEAELVNWLVAVGDTVVVDQPVAEVETAKSLVEVPSPFAGRVAQLHGSAGQSVDVGRPLISVDTAPVETPAPAPGLATAAAVGTADAAVSAAGEAYRQEEKAGSGNVLIGYGTPDTGHTARRTRAPKRAAKNRAEMNRAVQNRAVAILEGGAARAEDSAQTGHPGSAEDRTPGNRAQPGPWEPSRPQAPRCISPLVRRIAREAGLRLADLTGSGPDGLILRRDVEAALRTASAVLPGAVAAVVPSAGRPVEHTGPASGEAAGGSRDARTGLTVTARTPVRGLRRAAAATLSRSRSEIPEATVWVDVDATALVDLRAGLARDGESVPSLLSFLARFTLAGLARFPELNTRYSVEDGNNVPDGAGESSTGGEAVIEAFDGVNLGLAVQTPRGLMVPAVRRADTLSTRGLDNEIRRLTDAAQEGRATAAELTCGTFTLNNYGVFGVDGSAAIINHPESAILGVGRIIDKPWVVDGALAVRKMTELTLVFDHRVCDGATAGGFLRYVADAVENPARVLADL